MAKSVDISMSSITGFFGSIRDKIILYFTSLDKYEQYANIAMLVGIILIIIAVIL